MTNETKSKQEKPREVPCDCRPVVHAYHVPQEPMTNELETILKKFDEEFVRANPGYETGFTGKTYMPAQLPENVKSFISSSLKALLESLDKELEGKKVKEKGRNDENWFAYKQGFNEGLNLAQERIRGKLK